MHRLKTKDPTVYRLDAEDMDHLDALIKLLQRCPDGMSAEQVRRTAESLERLRTKIAGTAQRAEAA